MRKCFLCGKNYAEEGKKDCKECYDKYLDRGNKRENEKSWSELEKFIMNSRFYMQKGVLYHYLEGVPDSTTECLLQNTLKEDLTRYYMMGEVLKDKIKKAFDNRI